MFNQYSKKLLIAISIFLIYFIGNSFAISIPFVSKTADNKDNAGNIQVNINGITYNLDTNDTPCKSINISNGRLNCVMDINGEEVVADAIILDNNIDITGSSTFNSNLAMYITFNNESFNTSVDHILFSIYSDYSYKIDGYSASELTTKQEFQKKTDTVLKNLQSLKDNYVNISELRSLPLNKNNKYCDINTDSTCKFTYTQFLKKDPLTKKINLDLLINYSD